MFLPCPPHHLLCCPYLHEPKYRLPEKLLRLQDMPSPCRLINHNPAIHCCSKQQHPVTEPQKSVNCCKPCTAPSSFLADSAAPAVDAPSHPLCPTPDPGTPAPWPAAREYRQPGSCRPCMPPLRLPLHFPMMIPRHECRIPRCKRPPHVVASVNAGSWPVA